LTKLTHYTDVIKYFGFELGAQTNNNPNDDRWIINGAHDASKLQEYLDGFISRFVLCKKCKNPETVMEFKNNMILLDCKACGQRSDVDLRLKLSGFIIKNQPKKGKKDKATKKADRRARKEAGLQNDDVSQNDGSPNDSASDHAEENGDFEIEAGSDDELTRQINEGAKEIDESSAEKEVEWATDFSANALKSRAEDLPEDLKRALVIEDEDAEGEGGSSVYDVFGKWMQDSAADKGGVDKLENVDIYIKAKELGIETKHRTLTVLAQTLFDASIVKQIEKRAPMLKKLITSEKHEKAFLGGTERFVGNEMPELIPQVSAILIKYYENDLVSEEFLQAWGSKASKRYVDIKTSRAVRKSAEKFMDWLNTPDEDSEEEDSE
jgi:translation initiation factor 5